MDKLVSLQNDPIQASQFIPRLVAGFSLTFYCTPGAWERARLHAERIIRPDYPPLDQCGESLHRHYEVDPPSCADAFAKQGAGHRPHEEGGAGGAERGRTSSPLLLSTLDHIWAQRGTGNRGFKCNSMPSLQIRKG